MKYTNLLEKIVSIFNITGNSWVNLTFLAFFVIILLLICMKKISKKTGFILSLIGDIVLIIYTVIIHYEEISKLMDSIINHLFVDIYFPSIYVYLFVFLFINIVTIGSLLNIKKTGIYHTINGICFLVTNFVFALLLDIISKNKIDVFSKSSLFSNTDIIILLEFSVSIFGIWLVSLGVFYLTNIISERILLHGTIQEVVKKSIFAKSNPLELKLDEIKNTDQEEIQDTNIIPEESKVPSIIETEESSKYKYIPTFETNTSPVMNKQLIIEEAYSKQNKEEVIPTFIPVKNQQTLISEVPQQVKQEYVSNISLEQNKTTSNQYFQNYENNDFDLSSFIPKKQQNRFIQTMDTNTVFEKILNNQLPLTQKQEVINPYEEEKNTYTLNDYRIFNKILKDIKEHNQNNTIHIDKILEYRLITKYSSETYDLFKRMLKNYSN